MNIYKYYCNVCGYENVQGGCELRVPGKYGAAFDPEFCPFDDNKNAKPEWERWKWSEEDD